jgi:hypothetical protein
MTITASQINEMQDYLNQLQQITTTINESSSYLEHDIVLITQKNYKIRNKYKFLTTRGMTGNEIETLENISAQCKQLYLYNRKNLVLIQKKILSHICQEAAQPCFYVASQEQEVVEIQKKEYFKKRIAAIEKVSFDKEVNALIARAKMLLLIEPKPLASALNETSSCSESSLSSASSASSSIDSIASDIEIHPNALDDALFRLHQVAFQDNLDSESMAKELVKITYAIPLHIGDTSMEMPIGGLVFYHLHLIQIHESHPGAEKQDPDYSVSAFQNLNGCTSTLEQKDLAVVRTLADMLLYGYRTAVETNDKQRQYHYFGLIKHLDRETKSRPFHKFKMVAFKKKESRLKYTDNIRTKMHAFWYFN